MSNYDWLLAKLDAFIRKYYTNQLIRGSLIFLICLLFYFLTISVSEYYLYLPAWLRTGLVSAFILFGTSALIIWVIIPLTKIARLGKVISHEKAASIIGRFFPEISDKLLNILQLKKHSNAFESMELIEASIDQKAGQISILPITSAIDFSKNKKYLPYLIPLVVAGIAILIFSPSIFIDASQRLMQPTKTFEKPAPFKFVIKTSPLQAVRNTDFILKVSVEGEALPDELFLESGNDRIPMVAAGKNNFHYTFKNVTEAVSFRFYAAGFYSREYKLKVTQRPILKSFRMQLDFPSYTGVKDETRNSLGDIHIPAGTMVHWLLVAEHADQISIKFGEANAVNMQSSGGGFSYQARFFNDTIYKISLMNRESGFTEEFEYHVQVIPDQFPVIQLREFRDTVSGKQILLSGTAGDDYGISRLLFHYQILNERNLSLSSKAIPRADLRKKQCPSSGL